MLNFNKETYGKVASFVLTYQAQYDKNPTLRHIAKDLKISRDDARLYAIYVFNKEELQLYTDEELKIALQKESARVQRFMDSNRILRKIEREHIRLPNAIEANQIAMLELLQKYQYKNPISAKSKAELFSTLGDIMSGVGIIHISDPHINELVKLAGINIYDIPRASKMLKKFITQAILDFKAAGFRKVLVVCTGDIINSDRRIDEKLSMATNRMKAKFIAIELFRAALIDLSHHFDNIYFAGVTGNESRIGEELGWNELITTDNYDYDVYKALEYLFAGHPKIHILEQDNYTEYPISVAGQWILLTHGMQRTLQGDVEKGVIQMTGKWSDYGYKIAFILFGHLHYTRIGDHFARGASWVGANAYSANALQLITKSSQLLHFIYSNGDIYNKRIDLTNVDDVIGYPYNKELESYNSKSKMKTRDGRTILEIKV
ncbi:MAG TPA: hypothetical protein VMZ29_00030 [Candidatus Bathyarchaeia archaeon]|nr:hypothetical protein [Candidatus Bathyarchaeia archaeon]